MNELDKALEQIKNLELSPYQPQNRLQEVVKKARQEALENACKAVCDDCANGVAVQRGEVDCWYHDGYDCYATYIRNLMEKDNGSEG